MSYSLSMVKTPSGHSLPDAVSAFQKCVRRGEERMALYFASEIDMASQDKGKVGYGGYLWSRIMTIVAEDIGPAEPGLAADVRALHAWWLDYKKDKKTSYGILIADAVIRICRARKCRVADHAYCVFWRDKPMRGQMFEIPDYALDEHTAAGRKMGRGWNHFVQVAAHLENVSTVCDDPYFEEFIEGCKQFGNPDTYMENIEPEPESVSRQTALFEEDES